MRMCLKVVDTPRIWRSGLLEKIRYWLAKVWLQNRDRTLALLAVLLGSILSILLYRYWGSLDSYLLSQQSDMTRRLALSLGAAITGLVAITFSLTLFTVQQAANKGTVTMLEELAHDKGLWATYFFFAFFVVACFFFLFLPLSRHYQTAVAVCEFSLIVLTFALLRRHFRRAIDLVNAKEIVGRYHRRGLKQLKEMKNNEDRIVRANIKRKS